MSRYLTSQPNISDGEATDLCQKGAPQDGGLPELIVAQSCLTNHSEAASLWLATLKQDVVRNHQWRHWRVVCCNVEDLNFGVQNLHPSYIKVIFQRPSCRSPIAVASGFIAVTAPVVRPMSSMTDTVTYCILGTLQQANMQTETVTFINRKYLVICFVITWSWRASTKAATTILSVHSGGE